MNNNSDLIFNEQQKFAPWVHAIMISAFVFSAVTFYATFHTESAKDNPPDTKDILIMLFCMGLPIIVEILFFFLKLETEVRSDGLYVRLFPIHIKFKKFACRVV